VPESYHSHYRTNIIFQTLGKELFTPDKIFVECYTRQRTLNKYFIGKWFFAEYFFQVLDKDFVEFSKTTRQRKALGKTRIANSPKKQQNIFLKLGEQPINHHHYPTIILIIFHKVFKLN
jgi:hypothetical protein